VFKGIERREAEELFVSVNNKNDETMIKGYTQRCKCSKAFNLEYEFSFPHMIIR
jgi:hypothetical protein